MTPQFYLMGNQTSKKIILHIYVYIHMRKGVFLFQNVITVQIWLLEFSSADLLLKYKLKFRLNFHVKIDTDLTFEAAHDGMAVALGHVCGRRRCRVKGSSGILVLVCVCACV